MTCSSLVEGVSSTLDILENVRYYELVQHCKCGNMLTNVVFVCKFKLLGYQNGLEKNIIQVLYMLIVYKYTEPHSYYHFISK